MLTALDVASILLAKVNTDKGDSISPLKLQKLVYYSQAWYYTFFGKPLFADKIEAWAHGPVVRSVWNKYKSFATRNQAIDLSKFRAPKTIVPEKTNNLLNDVLRVYGEHTGSYLEKLTHSETPWIKARNGIPVYMKSTNEITLASMKKYYSSLLKKKKR